MGTRGSGTCPSYCQGPADTRRDRASPLGLAARHLCLGYSPWFSRFSSLYFNFPLTPGRCFRLEKWGLLLKLGKSGMRRRWMSP